MFRASSSDIHSFEQNQHKIIPKQIIFEMSDMGIKYDMAVATKGEEEGKAEALKQLHDPGRHGTKEAQAAHAYATTSEVDPPVEMMGDHHHRHHDRLTKSE